MFNATIDGILTTMETYKYHNYSDYFISDSSNINNNYFNKNMNDDNELGSDDIVKILGPKRDPLYIVIPITIIYLLILITGIVGNISTCIVISKNKSMHTATNYYLFSLAISDFLLLISGAPQEVYYIWSRYPYIFGELFCILRGLTAETSANATVLTITAFTVERYVAICHPFLSHTMSKLSRAVRLIILVWIISVSFAIPQALQFGVLTTEGVEQCLVKHVIIQHSFELSSFLFFIAPMTLITVLYILIGLKLRSSSLIKRENGGTLQRRCNVNSCRQQNNQGTRRVLKMLVAVVVAFFICWAPFHAQRLVAIYTMGGEHFEPNEFVMKVYDIMTYISGILYYLSTCINPLLYNIMSNKFREAFKATLVKCCHLSKRGHDQERTYRVLSRSQRRCYGRQESTDCSGNSVRDDSIQSSSTQKQSIDSYSLVNQQYPLNKTRGNKLNYSHVFDIEECLNTTSKTKFNSDKPIFPFNSGINQSSKHLNNCTPCKELNNRQMILNLYQNHYNNQIHQHHHFKHNHNNHHHYQQNNTSNKDAIVLSNHDKCSPVSSTSSSSLNKKRTKTKSTHKSKNNNTQLEKPFKPSSTSNLKVIYNKHGELEIIMDNTANIKNQNIDRFAKRIKNVFCIKKSASTSFHQANNKRNRNTNVNFIDDFIGEINLQDCGTSKTEAKIVDHLKFVERDQNFVINVGKMISSNSSDDENHEADEYDDGLDISNSSMKDVNCIDLADELNLYMEEIKMREKRFEVNNAIAFVANSTDAFNSDIHECQPHFEEVTTTSVSVQTEVQTASKSIQANMKAFVSPILLWDTDKKLNTMTGLPKTSILNRLTKICQDARKNDDCFMPMKDRILLTMYKLKNNSSFAHLAILFQVCDKTAKLYFADTIQLLAKVMQKLIHWQSREQNLRSYPKCFEKFPNVRTVLDCTEFKTVTFQCLTCRTCTYSHYKGTHTLKLLIGVSPSGLINYISKVATGKSSDKAIFNISNLLSKLEKGDVVMVDKGFLIADELAKAGIELVRPEFLFNKFSKEDVDKNTYIASARVHVERRIARLKIFKVLSDKVDVAVLPYIDFIITVLSGLSNLGPPILTDDKF